MKIAIICTLYPPYILGGAEISVSLLAKGLEAQGNEVVVITTGPEKKEEKLDGVHVFRIKNKNIYWRYPQREKSIIKKIIWHLVDIYNPLYKKEIRRILEMSKPDVINTSNLCGISTMVWDIAHKMHIPIVHTLRDYYLLCPQQTMIKGTQSCDKQCAVCRTYSFIKKIMSQKVDALIGISDFIREKHLRFGYFKNASVVKTIPNSVNTNKTIDRVLNNKIGYIGRLSPEKGIEFMIDAFLKSEISKRHTLLIAGSGNKNYEQQLKNKYNEDKVQFVGQIKQTEFLKKIDLLVVPSLWDEPFGRVVIEAYASHCPVFMSSNGGLKELQVDGISWCFDTSSMDRLVHLFNDFNNKSLKISQMLFDNEIEKFLEGVIVSSYMDVFSKINKKQSFE